MQRGYLQGRLHRAYTEPVLCGMGPGDAAQIGWKLAAVAVFSHFGGSWLNCTAVAGKESFLLLQLSVLGVCPAGSQTRAAGAAVQLARQYPGLLIIYIALEQLVICHIASGQVCFSVGMFPRTVGWLCLSATVSLGS